MGLNDKFPSPYGGVSSYVEDILLAITECQFPSPYGGVSSYDEGNKILKAINGFRPLAGV